MPHISNIYLFGNKSKTFLQLWDCFAALELAMTPELGMQSIAVEEKPEGCQRKIQRKNFAWVDNPDIQRLLDVVSSIVAEEYIEIAKQNKGVFEIASGTLCPRNDEDKNGGGK